MTSRITNWLTVLALAALVASSGWWARAKLHAWTHDRVASELRTRLGSLPERRAAGLVRQLTESDAEWLDVLVSATTDSRASVAAAAMTSLEQLIEGWSAPGSTDSTPNVAALARLLAEHAPRLPPERVARAQSLAQRLLDWPVDSRRLDAAQLISDCEIVLRLIPAEEAGVRVAAVERGAGVPPAMRKAGETPTPQ
jgi:hypothetical protein